MSESVKYVERLSMAFFSLSAIQFQSFYFMLDNALEKDLQDFLTELDLAISSSCDKAHWLLL